MSDFETVAKVGEIAQSEGKTVVVGERLVALFCVDGKYHAIDDLCPHQGASLGAGCVQDGEVSCPWHGWRFRLEDGKWADNPRLGVDVFETRVVGDEVQIRPVPQPADG